jgi:type I restriction enzyme S subunit
MKHGWEVKKLGDVCYSKSSNVSQNQLADDVGDYPIFGASGLIKNVSFYHQEKPYLSIVKDGSGFGRVTKMDAFTSVIGTLQYILPNDEIDLDYLNYSLMSVDFKKYVQGAAIPHIYFKDYKNEPFLFMPLPEQQRIVAILDDAFTKIDKVKAIAEQNLKNTKELFESYLQGVFDNKGDVWVTDKFVNLCNLITCGVAATPKYVDESVGVPFLSAQNVRNGEVVLDKFKHISKEFHRELTKKNKPHKGDILYSRVGAKYGEAGVVEHDFEFSVYVSVTLIKPKPEKLDNYFLKHLLNSPSIKEVARKSISSSGVPNLNVKDVREFLISYPPITIQKKILSEIETMRAETQKLEALYQKKIGDLEELKKSILQKAFAGELK